MAHVSKENQTAINQKIRADLKKKFPNEKIRFTVRRENCTSITVTIWESPVDLLKDYPYPDTTHAQVNIYCIRESSYSPIAKSILQTIVDGMNLGNHDKSDAMTDYFDVGWYMHLNIGEWDKPFIYSPKAK